MNWQGIAIKKLAKTQNMTLTSLAQGIGVSRQTVNDWIKGQVPKGHHLILLCKTLNATPDSFFFESTGVVSVPVHRTRRRAKVTPAMQEVAIELAKEYELLFRSDKDSSVVPVIRVTSMDEQSAKKIASKLRTFIAISREEPMDYEHAFELVKKLGIKVIFRNFPESLNGYAFYTTIHRQRVIFVNNTTNVIDLIFQLIHESVHAIRDEENIGVEYDNEEEDFCDMVANYVQFPEEYVNFVRNTLKGLTPAIQINKLKVFGEKYCHSLFGIVKRIKNVQPSFVLNVGGADTNLKKKFFTIGERLFTSDNVSDYIALLLKLTPNFLATIKNQIDSLSDRKLGELLGVASCLDAREVKNEIAKLKLQSSF
jgi:transcriptional regulator with XRE-family HTH domain